MPLAPFGALRRTAAIAVALLVASSAASAHHTPGPTDYSIEQQTAAVTALSSVLTTFDALEQKLLMAYGETMPVLRMEEIKHGDVITAKAVETPSSLVRMKGSSVIRRAASFEPVFAACGLAQESIHVLGVVSDETEALLKKRALVKGDESANWAQAGAQEGLQRLKDTQELNCAPVRRMLTDTLPSLQDAYAKVYAVLEQDPEDTADKEKTAAASAGKPAAAPATSASTQSRATPAASPPQAPAPAAKLSSTK